MKQRRIVFIAGQLILGGAEQQLYYLLSGLDRSRFEPFVITLGSLENEYWEEPIRDLKVPLSRVPRNSGRAERSLRITALVRRLSPDIVHSWVFHTNAYAAVAGMLARNPLRVGSVRESISGLPDDPFLRWIGCRGLDLLVTNAAQTATELKAHGSIRAKVAVVPNGAVIPHPISQSEQARLREELGFHASELLIGTIGRLDRNKNHAMLIQSFALLAKDWPTLRLIIIGDGPLRSELQSMVEKMGIGSKVRLTGIIPTAARFLPAMDVCCLTSNTEGMPNIVMEAGAAGLPVVSTRCGDVASLIDDHVSGYLVPLSDHVSLAQRLNLLLSDAKSRTRMGQLSREKIRGEYSVDAMVSRMTRLYDSHYSGSFEN